MMNLPTVNTELVVDDEFVYKSEWIICRVQDIMYAPMGNVTQILVKYKLKKMPFDEDIDESYGYLWITIKCIKWMEGYECWKYNVVLSKQQSKSVEGNEDDLQNALFLSWWDSFVKKWIGDERKYIKMQEKNNLEQVSEQQSITPYKRMYLTSDLEMRRRYKSQKHLRR